MMGSSLHLAARAWAERGVPVFPCIVGGKKPAKEGGYKVATTNLDQVDKWWSEADYNVAIYPAGAGLVALDVDKHHGGDITLASMEIMHGELPKTYRERTPRGGEHRLFRGMMRSTTGKERRNSVGLDTRSIGGYIVTAPSVTEEGRYEVIEDPGGWFPDAPQWIGELATEGDAKPKEGPQVQLDLPINVEAFKRHAAAYPVVPDGQRNEAGTILVGYAVDYGLTRETAWPILVEEWGIRVGIGLNDKLYECGLWTHRQNSGAPLALSEYGSDAFGHLPEVQEAAKHRGPWHLWTYEEMEEEPEPAWLVQDILPDSGVGYLFGDSQTYKTYVALWLAAQVAETRDVVYVAGEGQRTIRSRLRSLYANLGSSRPRLRVSKRMPLVKRPDETVALISSIREREMQPALIVLDTFSKAMAGLTLKDDDAARELMMMAGTLQEAFACTVCGVAHTGHQNKERVAGSYALIGDADFFGKVDSPWKRSRLARLKVIKQKGNEEVEEPFHWEGVEHHGDLAFSPISRAEYDLRVALKQRADNPRGLKPPSEEPGA